MVESKEFDNENNETKQKCHDELTSLVEKFIEIKRLDSIESVLLLAASQFHLIKHSYSGQVKLSKLKGLGFSLREISKIFQDKNHAVKLYLLFEKILNYMQLITNVDLKVKTENISWFMYYYGTACNIFKDFTISNDILLKVIFLMKTIFGGDAANYKMYGASHHNYAVALYDTNRLIEAKPMFEEALKVYEKASDWDNEKQKIENIMATSRGLHKVNTKLQPLKKN